MLTLLRAACGAGRDCPNVNRAESGVYAGAYVVVGYTTDRPATVMVPAALVPEWDCPARRAGDLIRVTGLPVADAATLAELDMDQGESAVMVHQADVPALAEVLV